ncbi:nuclear transport factor 2 family protein [Nonomuraea sediminis]|uniref:nuclear transport factor 2 family protein n=1 Tax=Nonomuraea sediminis TaxID=2835864 RepID=UPI001BDCCBD0|nr:nuclear transport factor 2 family protein [Nonomuraea sediminis]
MTERELALAYYEAVDAADHDRLLSMFHPRVIYRRGGYPPIEGVDALRDFYENVRMIERGTHALDAIVCEADQVAVRGGFTGVSRDGRALSAEWADFLTFDHGLIRDRVTYFLAPGV